MGGAFPRESLLPRDSHCCRTQLTSGPSSCCPTVFAPALFNNLGGPPNFPVLYGCILLGGLTLVFVPLPFLLHRYGKKLRQSSKNASHI
jgi:hypothetical protein